MPRSVADGQLALEFRWLKTNAYVLTSPTLSASLKAEAPMLGVTWWRPLAPAWRVGLGGGLAHMSVEARLTAQGGQVALLRDRRTQAYGMASLQMTMTPTTRLQATVLGSRLRFDDSAIDLHQGRLTQLTLGLSHAF